MRLIDEKIGSMPAFHFDHLLQRSTVAEHAVDTFDDDEFVTLFAGKALQAPIQVLRIVVAEANDRGIPHLQAVIDAGVTIGVQQHKVLRSDRGGKNAEIGLIAGREQHYRPPAKETGQGLLDLAMDTVIAVGDSRAGGSGAIAVEGVLRGFDPGGLEGQSEIIEGPGKYGGPPADTRLGGR